MPHKLLADDECRVCFHAHPYGTCEATQCDPIEDGFVCSRCGCTEYVDLAKEATIIVETRPKKPLGRKAYGSIAHLPGSRLGPGDHKCSPGQERIATEQKRDAKDYIVVTEKLDGSCMSVAKVNGQIIPLGRVGYPAISSPYEQHRLFHHWALDHYEQFDALLGERERVVGEWMAQAHGTRYNMKNRSPFVVFDIIGEQGEKVVPRLPHHHMKQRAEQCGFVTVPLLHEGDAISLISAMGLAAMGHYGNEDEVEGVVYRVEREGKVDYLVKYVRPDKVDGCYLPDTDAGKAHGTTEVIWNWRPEGDKVKPWWK